MRLRTTSSKPGLQCVRCGGDLAGERCPTCRARRARWIAYGIVGPIAVVATDLDIRLGGRWHDSARPGLSMLLLATFGGLACVRAFASTRATVDRVLFVIGIVCLVGLLSFATFYYWLARAFEGG